MKNTLKWIVIGLLSITLIVVLPGILNYFIGRETPTCIEYIAGNEGDWVGFWGSFAGAILAAIVTFMVMYRESKQNALNIMVNNQENLIKELKESLIYRISEFQFWYIGKYSLTSSETYKEHIDNTLDELNSLSKELMQQFNAWGVIYENSKESEIQVFNKTYDEFVTQYNKDIDEITKKLYELKTGGKYDVFKNWLKDFNTKLENHHYKYAVGLYNAAKNIIDAEQTKLDNWNTKRTKIL